MSSDQSYKPLHDKDHAVQVNITINKRDFYETPVHYVTLPHLSFDGENYHLAFFVTTPAPTGTTRDEDEPVQATTVARLALSGNTVATLFELLRNVVTITDDGGYLLRPEELMRGADRGE